MNPKRLQNLINLYQKEMPSLRTDLENASTHHALQPACMRLFRVTGAVLAAVLEDQLASKGETAPPPAEDVNPHQVKINASTPTPKPAPAPAPAPEAALPVLDDLEDAGAVPGIVSLAPPGLPANATFTPGIQNTFVTQSGVTHVGPDGRVEAETPPKAVDVEIK